MGREGLSQRDGSGILAERTKAFALQIIQLFASLPRTTEAQVLGKQLLRSGTSVGAQYREGLRARSRAEFVSKIESTLQELEETKYWLELLTESRIRSGEKIQGIQKEADQLLAMLTASAKTAKARK